jgi:hypothetical protein
MNGARWLRTACTLTARPAISLRRLARCLCCPETLADVGRCMAKVCVSVERLIDAVYMNHVTFSEPTVASIRNVVYDEK